MPRPRQPSSERIDRDAEPRRQLETEHVQSDPAHMQEDPPVDLFPNAISEETEDFPVSDDDDVRDD